jgi:hypothetical protein
MARSIAAFSRDGRTPATAGRDRHGSAVGHLNRPLVDRRTAKAFYQLPVVDLPAASFDNTAVAVVVICTAV